MKAVCLSAYRVLITPVRQIFSSYKSLFLSFVFIAGLLPQQLLAEADTAGFIPGELSVGQGGAATYTMPIGVPAGVAGMQPELSINYNSNGGNGLLGVGFSLGGMSAITRCPATFAQDGEKGGVYFDERDRFCLDGQRLIPISGANGAIGTEYRTEIDGFSKIISYGQQGGGLSWWKVWTKSGQILEYGNTEDSRVEVVGKTSVLFWAVNKISDAVDNQINYSYNKDAVNGEHNVDEIMYSNVAVKFQYQARSDTYGGFLFGGKANISKRLSVIESSVNGQLVKKYTLGYRYSDITGRSQLLNINECDSEGNCFPPTQFGYELSSEGLSTSYKYTNPNLPVNDVMSINKIFLQDVDKDGRTDLAVLGALKKKVYVYRGKLDGTFETSPVTSSIGDCLPNVMFVELADINADGFLDVVNVQSNPSRVCVLFGRGDGGFESVVITTTITANLDDLEVLRFNDLNADGYTDLLVYTEDGIASAYLSLGDGTFSEFDPGYVKNCGFSVSEQLALRLFGCDYHDVNGDGLADAVLKSDKTSTAKVAVRLSKGNIDNLETSYITTAPPGDWVPRYYDIRFIDVNGDGALDYVWTKDSEFVAYVFLGHGDGSFELTPVTTDIDGSGWSATNYTNDFIDMNGDGVVDLVMTNINNGTIHIFPGKGDGFFDLTPKTIDPDGAYGYSYYKHQFADVDNDGKTDYVILRKGYAYAYAFLSEYSSDRVSEITDGLGATTAISYTPMSYDSVYLRGTGSTYPEIDLAGPMQVVSNVTTPDGLGGTHSTEYKYGGLKVNVLGRGSLGFAWMQATDNQTGIVTKTEYSQTYPYVGQVTKTEQKLSDGTLLGETTASFNHTLNHNDKVYFPYTEQTIDKKYDLDGTLLATTTTDNVFDTFANPTRITVTTVDSEDTVIKDTLSDYINDTLSDYINDIHVWHLGRLTRASVTHSNSQGSITRTSAFTYNSDGLLATEIIEPDNPGLSLHTEYQYDNFGNKIQVTTSGQGIESRNSSTTYSADGRFPETVTNALGHSETRTYDPLLGVMTSLTGPNQLTTTWQYDGFGRKIREDRADGTWSTITRGQCGVTDCPEDAPEGTGLYTITESSGSTPATVFSDQLGRETRKVKTGFDGTLVYEDTEYNSLGQISRKSQPYFKGDTTHWASSEYDILGRVKKVSQQGHNGVVENTFSYSGFSTTAITASNITNLALEKTTRKNAQGKVVRVDEEEGGWVTYKYDAIGNLLETNANGVVTTLTYDLRGRKKTMDDPDMGHWTYEYNVLGELTSQTDAKAQETTMSYDKLGRMVERTEHEGTSTWTYYTADTAEPENKGIGKLAKVEASDGYLQQITYDNLGRASTTSTTADGKTLTTTTEYDSFSRVSRTIRPEGFILDNAYNTYGYLKAVHSPTAQIGDNDSSHIRFLLDTAINDAESALTKAQEVADAAIYYQQKADEYQQLSGTPELDPALEAQLQSIAAELDAAADILNTQAVSYIELAEQLVEVAEQLDAREQILLQRYAYSGENSNISDYQAMVDDSDIVYFWRAQSRDAAGRLTSSIVGNGLETKKFYNQATGQLTDIISSFGYATPTRKLEYTYDELNSVTSRVDHVLGMSESFQYDRQDRLTRSQVQGQIGDINYDYAVDYGYDAMGNMLHKTDVGDYIYGDQSRTTGNAGPHALLSAGPDHSGYQYDANGNMLQGGGRNITWNSFNKPTEFRKDGTLHASFKYGPDRARYLKVTSASRTLYLGKAYERIESEFDAENNPKKIEHKHFIYAEGQLLAIHVKSTDDGVAQQDKTRYLHRDSLGSIDTITDGQGNIVDRMSYEPFGARRGGDWRAFTGEPYIPALTNRGFTGHEHVDEMNLIHMNGRVYDPQLGRFLSADPTMQFPYSSQGYNRYSYVQNNPLKYTDPSGYGLFSSLKKFFKKVFKFIKKHIRTIAAIAAAAVVGPWAFSAVGGGILGGVVGGAAAGFVSGGIMSGTLKGAFRGAIFGGISGGFAYGIGDGAIGEWIGKTFGDYAAVAKDVAHGLVQGTVSELAGGDFKSGFIGAFIGHAAGRYAKAYFPGRSFSAMFKRTMSAAVAGGVGSTLGGGKFKNGAVSAAFAHLFNNELESWSNYSECQGQCHGYDGKLGRSMTPEEELGLYASTLFIPGGGAVGTINTIGNATKLSKALSVIERFLGKEVRVLTNRSGDKILMSQNKKIRFDFNNSHGDKAHMHFEVFRNGKWRDAFDQHRFYPR